MSQLYGRTVAALLTAFFFFEEDIKIRFFETDESGDSEIWEAYADFSELDVHHQYAIAFKYAFTFFTICLYS